MNRSRYTISFLPSDSDLVNHLEKVKGHTTISMYVRSLIKKDLCGDYQSSSDIDQIVEKVIQTLKEDDRFQLSINSDQEELAISDEQKDVIMSLF